ITFTDSLNGWIVGGSYYSVILRTTDGGESWKEIDSAKNLGQLYRIRFSDKNNALIMGQFGSLHRTTDAGNSWNQLRDENIFIRSVSFADENAGWAVGDSGLILNTTDGGNNWVKQYYDRDRLLYSVHAIDKNNAWATGGMLHRVGEPDVPPKPQVLYTTDGGKHWLEKEGDYLSGGFYFITFHNDSLGWLAGKVLLKTTNKGQTWEKIPIDFKSPLNRMQFINDSTGWLSYSSDENMILKTTDGGKTWNEQLVDSAFSVRSFFFVNEKVGYAVGTLQWKEAIIKTTNGGKSWFQINKPLIGGYESIYFKNETDGWIGGFDLKIRKSVIIKTTDGGDTWLDQNCPFNGEVTNFCFLNSSTAWAVGNGIAKTTNGGDIVSVERDNNEHNTAIPSNMDLMQNYPNPFNPSTMIQYKISKAGFVSLKVYDLLGRQITTLVDQYQKEGEYKVRWSAENLPSGIYIYEIRTNNFTKSGKMLLLK
ncbi:MAG: YCF48-related protein, partial [Bacteroidota bacterium]|nr:YCF48-related protein [Bacteroidota bacterium]